MEELKALLNLNRSNLVVSSDWLGGGSNSVVLKGTWIDNGKLITVAIKKIKLISEEVAGDICKELKLMQKLSSEHICKIYGGCMAQNDQEAEVWLVMEYADGRDLNSFLDKYSAPLPVDLQLSFFLQTTKALATLHNATEPILHRDIKSLNFLVQNGSRILLTDFGLSKTKALMTAKSFTIGTVRWVAPEIVASSKPQWSEKADIYSLGMVFYEIVTRVVPYHDDPNLKSILEKIKTGTLPKLPADCPKEVNSIIRTCCDLKASKRPTVDKLLELIGVKLGPTPMYPELEEGDPNSKTSAKKSSLLRSPKEKTIPSPPIVNQTKPADAAKHSSGKHHRSNSAEHTNRSLTPNTLLQRKSHKNIELPQERSLNGLTPPPSPHQNISELLLPDCDSPLDQFIIEYTQSVTKTASNEKIVHAEIDSSARKRSTSLNDESDPKKKLVNKTFGGTLSNMFNSTKRHNEQKVEEAPSLEAHGRTASAPIPALIPPNPAPNHAPNATPYAIEKTEKTPRFNFLSSRHSKTKSEANMRTHNEDPFLQLQKAHMHASEGALRDALRARAVSDGSGVPLIARPPSTGILTLCLVLKLLCIIFLIL